MLLRAWLRGGWRAEGRVDPLTEQTQLVMDVNQRRSTRWRGSAGGRVDESVDVGAQLGEVGADRGQRRLEGGARTHPSSGGAAPNRSSPYQQYSVVHRTCLSLFDHHCLLLFAGQVALPTPGHLTVGQAGAGNTDVGGALRWTRGRTDGRDPSSHPSAPPARHLTDTGVTDEAAS